MFDRLFGANFFNVDAGRRPAAVAAPVLDLRAPRGVHPDLARPSASCPRSSRCSPASRCSATRSWSSPASPSASWAGACGPTTCSPPGIGPISRGRVLAVDDVHRRADRREDPQLDRHHVGRQAAASRRRCCSPSAWSSMFTIGGLSGVTHAVSPADTQQTDTYYIVAHFHYVLFGGARPRLLRRLLLLVAEGVRQHAQREARQVELLADAHRLQPDVRPDAHPRPAGHAAAHLHLPATATASTSGTWSRTIGAFIIAVGVLMFFVNVFYSRRKAKAGRAAGPDPWDARSLEWMIRQPAAGAQLRRDPDGARARRVLAPQVRRGRGRPAACAGRRPTEDVVASRATPTSTSTCRRRRTGRSCSAFGLPIIGYGLIFNLWLCVIGGAHRARRHLRLGARAVDDAEAPTTTTTTTPHGRRRRRPAELSAGRATPRAADERGGAR